MVMPSSLVCVQNAAERRDIGAATGCLLFLRSMGGAFGSTLVGALLASGFAARLARLGITAHIDLGEVRQHGARAGRRDARRCCRMCMRRWPGRSTSRSWPARWRWARRWSWRWACAICRCAPRAANEPAGAGGAGALRQAKPFPTAECNVMKVTMLHPLAPTAGVASRLAVAGALLAAVWLAVAWALW